MQNFGASNLYELTAVISTISSIVIIFFVTIGNGSAQTKVYTVSSVICFTTVTLGVMMNKSLADTGNFTINTILLNILFIMNYLPQLQCVSRTLLCLLSACLMQI